MKKNQKKKNRSGSVMSVRGNKQYAVITAWKRVCFNFLIWHNRKCVQLSLKSIRSKTTTKMFTAAYRHQKNMRELTILYNFLIWNRENDWRCNRWFYFCLIGPFNYISYYESVPQPWYNPLWLTGLKAPTNWLTCNHRSKTGAKDHTGLNAGSGRR